MSGTGIPAAVIRTYGSAPERDAVALPERPAGHVRLAVLAAALNPVDVLMSSGSWYGGNPPLPHVPGREGVGRVLEDAAGWTAGDVVHFRSGGSSAGTLVAETWADPATFVAVPPRLDPVSAAAVGWAGTTASLALLHRGGLRAGERVLVLGANGSVGRAGAQIAVAAGARQVIAVVRDLEDWRRVPMPESVDVVVLDEAPRQDRADALRDAVLTAATGPIDLVLDPVWGAPARAALRALGRGGRLVTVGTGAGTALELPGALLRAQALDVRGHTNAAVDPATFNAQCAEVLALRVAGHLVLPHETFALTDVAHAWERLRARPRVKVVVVP